MTQGFFTACYLAASVLFVLSLGGLSHQESARRGNFVGMVGMAIALLATILSPHVTSYGYLFGTLACGAIVGGTLAKRVKMTEMPELVAILHSFVGLAAVLVGYSNFLEANDLMGAEKIIHEI